MHYTMEGLLHGQPVGDYYRDAINHWNQVLANLDRTDPMKMAGIADAEQMWFERNCGGRWPGQEVMVWSGICQYYTTANGFDNEFDSARAMYEGLLKSGCSIEIKAHAEEVAKLYPELKEEE